MLMHPILSTRFPLSHVAACKWIPCVLVDFENVVRGIATEPSYSVVVDRAGLVQSSRVVPLQPKHWLGGGPAATCGLPGVWSRRSAGQSAGYLRE